MNTWTRARAASTPPQHSAAVAYCRSVLVAAYHRVNKSVVAFEEHMHLKEESFWSLRQSVLGRELTDEQRRDRAVKSLYYIQVMMPWKYQREAEQRQERESAWDRAMRHAADCWTCQEDVTRTLGRDWSPL